MAPPVVRSASASDATACRAIYAPYVRDTAITFDVDPPTEAQMAEQIERSLATHAWLVLEDADRVVGYAYGVPHRERAAYRWSCEVSVYIEAGRRRSGAGRALYRSLLERLELRGYCLALAGITLPNAPSVGLHHAMGFEPVGTFRRVGFKHGAWHDVGWMQLALADGPPAGEPGRSI
jgi:phosphinothricin acetyltransferase